METHNFDIFYQRWHERKINGFPVDTELNQIKIDFGFVFNARVPWSDINLLSSIYKGR